MQQVFRYVARQVAPALEQPQRVCTELAIQCACTGGRLPSLREVTRQQGFIINIFLGGRPAECARTSRMSPHKQALPASRGAADCISVCQCGALALLLGRKIQEMGAWWDHLESHESSACLKASQVDPKRSPRRYIHAGDASSLPHELYRVLIAQVVCEYGLLHVAK